MTDPIKSKIQELCPDVMEGETNYRTTTKSGRQEIEGWQQKPLTLAVVLRAIAQATLDAGCPFVVDSAGQIYDVREQDEVGYLKTTRASWNLEKNYDQQSGECKQFIGSLLGVV